MRYWKYVKSAYDVKDQIKQPNKGPYVKEEIKSDGQGTTIHTLTVHRAEDPEKVRWTKIYTAYCGYDRGPKRYDLIRRLILNEFGKI